MKQSYRYSIPTIIYAGPECIKNNADYIASLGKKAFIISSPFPPGATHYSLQDFKAVCEEKGIEYKVFSDVIDNPPVESVAEVTRQMAEFGTEFIAALGGGSAIDTAKAANVLLKFPGEDPYEVFYDGKHCEKFSSGMEGKLPIIAAPTTAGTGSEVTGASILTREDTDTKLNITQKAFVTAAFLDPKNVKDAPPRLVHTGVLDSLAHGIEGYLNLNANLLTNGLASAGFDLFRQFKDSLLTNEYTIEDHEKMQLHAVIMGFVIHAGTTIPHGMGYALSHHKHVPHGLACAVFLAEYMRSFKDNAFVQPVVDMCGFKTVDEFADYLHAILDKDLDVKVTRAEIQAWSEEMMTLESRLVKHPEKVTVEDIVKIYTNSLVGCIVD